MEVTKWYRNYVHVQNEEDSGRSFEDFTEPLAFFSVSKNINQGK